ncbi:hypothetical protein [Mesorhizobium sp. ES1-4]|uniref:hypothetical protein n=1 Tax=Mesorhizobium sp. ES1-4 TaxID=2876627 RepID=UPI001CCBFFC3|nr:hypothetical protein [Mesorhizobium sp. ES1-4]MBZ9799421.1 hypothetical protein [Mesorhizobium sp. ES1-4]
MLGASNQVVMQHHSYIPFLRITLYICSDAANINRTSDVEVAKLVRNSVPIFTLCIAASSSSLRSVKSTEQGFSCGALRRGRSVPHPA